jgi:hypothetical protein
MFIASTNRYMFVGPSSYGVDPDTLCDAGYQMLPPARRGSIAALTQAQPPGELVLVDGTFHTHPAVGHAELREAIEVGWIVWGLSSMGAIRACEMRHLGMRGYGRSYQRFVSDEEFSDDEVALLHEAEPPYRAISEPLIHIREFIDSLAADEILDAGMRQAVIHDLKHTWYGNRTLSALASNLERVVAPSVNDEIALRLANFSPYRIKTLDLIAFLEHRKAHQL